MKPLYGIVACLLGAGSLSGSLPQEAVPWTKSFLETKVASQINRYCLSTRHGSHAPYHQLDGMVYASSAPIEDWEFDLGVVGRSLPTGKLFARSERQVFSDLGSDPLALTVVVEGSYAGRQRAHEPVFFEMARYNAQTGVGIGRHICIRKDAYFQIFSYLMAGAGASRARWVSGEIGVQEVFSRRHFLRCSVGEIKTYGHSHHYRGVGTMSAHINTVSLGYAYRRDDGIEGALSYTYRHFEDRFIRAQSMLLVRVSVPIGL